MSAILDTLETGPRQKVEALLDHPEPAFVRQGVELVRAAGDASLHDLLFAGTRVVPHAPPGAAELRPGPRLERWLGVGRHVVEVAALLAEAPHDGLAGRLRDALTDLLVRGPLRPGAAVDLGGLAGLPRLSRLVVHTLPVTGWEALGRSTSLREIELFQAPPSLAFLDHGHIVRLRARSARGLREVDLSEARSLRELHLDVANDLVHLRGLGRLRALSVKGAARLESLEGLHALESLALTNVGRGPRPPLDLATLPALRQVELSWGRPTDPAVTRSLPATVTHLLVEGVPPGFVEAADLGRLEEVQELTLGGAELPRALPPLPHLSSLALRGGGPLPALAGLPALTHLELWGCSAVDDLQGLVAGGALLRLRSLRVVASNVSRLRGIDAMPALERLEVIDAGQLVDIAAVRRLPLKRLRFERCYQLEALGPLGELGSLQELDIRVVAAALRDVPENVRRRLTRAAREALGG